ncbi:hypothetical protein SANA_30730 [Gottschalkiaceae bacterium SANA]|nr:hypothetical protein SANA_30730 [Gottschalkiaceae bacterium SANA]
MKMMDPISEDPVKRITSRGLVVAGVISIILSLVLPNPNPIVKGFLIGAIINLLNFRLMTLSLIRTTSMPQSRVQGYAMGQYMIRYTIYGIVLYFAFRSPSTNGIATACGYFLVKSMILADVVLQSLQGKTRKKGGR